MDPNTLIAGWYYAPKSTRQQGCSWYDLAHATCEQIATDYSVSLETVCGITSALSPGLNWDSNLTWSCRVLEHSAQFKTVKPSLFAGFTGYHTSLYKAWDIAKGTKRTPDCFIEQSAPKTRSFYFNLLDPTDCEPVTIDRHAAAALLELPRTKPIAIPFRKYRQFASIYREAAAQLHLIPQQLQATLWILQRGGWQLPLF